MSIDRTGIYSHQRLARYAWATADPVVFTMTTNFFCQNGDYLLLFLATYDSTTTFDSIDCAAVSSWEELFTGSNTGSYDGKIAVYGGRIDTPFLSGGTVTVDLNASKPVVGHLLVFSNVDPDSPHSMVVSNTAYNSKVLLSSLSSAQYNGALVVWSYARGSSNISLSSIRPSNSVLYEDSPIGSVTNVFNANFQEPITTNPYLRTALGAVLQTGAGTGTITITYSKTCDQVACAFILNKVDDRSAIEAVNATTYHCNQNASSTYDVIVGKFMGCPWWANTLINAGKANTLRISGINSVNDTSYLCWDDGTKIYEAKRGASYGAGDLYNLGGLELNIKDQDVYYQGSGYYTVEASRPTALLRRNPDTTSN